MEDIKIGEYEMEFKRGGKWEWGGIRWYMKLKNFKKKVLY